MYSKYLLLTHTVHFAVNISHKNTSLADISKCATQF